MLVALACAAACGGPLPAGPSAAPATGLGEVEPIASLDPSVAGLTCGDGHVFHPALLGQTGRAEGDQDAAAAALRAHLAGPDGAGSPRSGWIRVAQTGSRAQFVATRPDGDGWVVVGFFLNAGRWTLDLAGDCRPEVVLPAGVSRAEWRLDPAFGRPAPADRVVHLLINELACASGRSPEGRVLPPTVAATAGAVVIAVLVRSQPGAQDCQGNPDFPLTVDLPEALGERPLFDGAVFPPAGPATLDPVP